VRPDGALSTDCRTEASSEGVWSRGRVVVLAAEGLAFGGLAPVLASCWGSLTETAAKSTTHVASTESTTHVAATESTTYVATTESTTNVSATESTANVSATESTTNVAAAESTTLVTESTTLMAPAEEASRVYSFCFLAFFFLLRRPKYSNDQQAENQCVLYHAAG